MTDRKWQPRMEWLKPLADGSVVHPVLAREIEPANGRILVPYVYGGSPPSHPDLCDGCGMLHARCRCISIQRSE